MGLGHGAVLMDGFRDQQGLDRRRRAATTNHHLEHSVQGLRIRTAGLNNRANVIDVFTQHLGRHARLVTGRPIDIACKGVDFAVVGERAEGLRQAPGREGIGGIALVVEGKIGNETLVQKIRVERRKLLGQEHALVNDRPAGKRADIEFRDVLGQHLFFNAPANDVQMDLELVVADAQVVGDHDLFNLGPGDVGFFADGLDVHGHLPPSVNGVTEPEDFGLDDAAAFLLGAEVGFGQKHHADG